MLPNFAIAVTVLSVLGQAHAQSSDLSVGDFNLGSASISISFGASHLDRDFANGFSSALTDAAAFVVGLPDDGYALSDWGYEGTISGTLGITSGNSALDFIALEIDGRFHEMSRASSRTLGAGEQFTSLFVDGNINGGNTFVGPGELLGRQFDAEYNRYSFFLGGGRETTGPLTLALGVAGSVSHLELATLDRNASVPGRFASLAESVDTWSLGPRVSVGAEAPISRYVSVFGLVSASALYTQGNLEAHQVSDDNGIQGRLEFDAHDSARDLAAHFSARTGVDVFPTAEENLQIGIFGGIDWRNDAYEVINPSLSEGQQVGVDLAQAANLGQTSEFSASVGARLRFRF